MKLKMNNTINNKTKLKGKVNKQIIQIYLPPWQKYFVGIIIFGVLLLTTYMEFFNPQNDEKLGIVGFVLLCLILVISGGVTWLMSSGKLPAYTMVKELLDDSEEEQ